MHVLYQPELRGGWESFVQFVTDSFCLTQAAQQGPPQCRHSPTVRLVLKTELQQGVKRSTAFSTVEIQHHTATLKPTKGWR